MKLKRLIVVVLILSMLAMNAVHPKPAQASSSNTAVIVLVSLAAYVAVVFAATAYVYGNRTPTQNFAPDINDARRLGASRHSVRVGLHCAQDSGNVTLVCW